MNLVFIYGPPAVGKFSTAKELCKVIKYKILHNHLTIDLASSIFEFGTDVFFDLNNKMKLEIIKTASEKNTNGIILTFCFYSSI